MKTLFTRNTHHKPARTPERQAVHHTPLDTEKAFSESLLALETADEASTHEASYITQAVIRDAYEHLSHILPESPHVESSPTLRDVYLLARAYDLTKDDKILTALAYILDTAPPAFTDELRQAYQQAVANGTPIMEEHTVILDEADTPRERPRTAEDVDFAQAMQEKTPPEYRNTEWDERVRRQEEKD